MGTPEFAGTSLEFLVNNSCNVAGVITQPDKPQGRKMTLTPPPVKEYALSKNIAVYQPSTLRGQEFQELLEAVQPDIIILVAYGKLLPKNVLDFPKYGCVNIHGSLLPKYRGASPITEALMQGDKVTGITSMYMDEGLDTGDMILKEELAIGENENFGELHDRMAVLGGEVLIKTLELIEKGIAPREKQIDGDATHTKKIDNDTCVIDWNVLAREIHNKIRALSPNIGAFSFLDGKKLKIFKSEVIAESDVLNILKDKQNGELCINGKNIYVKTKDGALRIHELQLEGTKKMTAADFANGYGKKLTGGLLK